MFLHEADGSGQRLVVSRRSRSRNVFRDPAELQVHVVKKPKQQHRRLQLSSTPVQRLLERLEPAAQSSTNQHRINLDCSGSSGSVSENSQRQVGVGLLEDPLGVEVIGGEMFGPADDGVDLLRQLLGLLFQLLMLLHTETQQLPTANRLTSV